MTHVSFAALCILTVTAMPLSVAAKPLWLTDMDESALVYNNSVPGIDINAATRQLVLEHMPGHQDSVTIVNNERAFQMLKTDVLACTGNKIRNSERESFAYFSDVPQLIFPGLRLYMLKATAETAGITAQQHSRHSFADISTRLPRSRIGVVGGRNYGEPLQAIFNQLAARNRIYTRTGNDMSAAAMLDMLANGRVDLVVEYPNVVQHYSEALNHAVELVSVEISEAAEYTGGFIMCSKTEQGKKLAQQYSNAIQLASKDKRYLQAHLRWFDVSSHHKVTALYNKVYNTEF